VFASKAKSALSVYSNFGAIELLSLIAIKLGLKRTEAVIEISKISNPEIIDHFKITVKVLEILFNKSGLALNMNDQNSINLEMFNSDANKVRDGFFQEIYDLGPGALKILSFTISNFKPRLILETGVAAGKSSNLILTRLSELGAGKLVSIDITEEVGELVREHLKVYWDLLVLKPLFKKRQFKKIVSLNCELSIFLHDSNHAPRWQLFEIETVLNLAPRCGVLIVDDITHVTYTYLSDLNHLGTLYLIREPNKTSGIFIREGVRDRNEEK
jgi:predicted O-methyltransferase YrrM